MKKNLMSYIPKGKRSWVTDFYFEPENGYWLTVGINYWVDDMDCHTIHEDTIADVLRVLKSCRLATQEEIDYSNR